MYRSHDPKYGFDRSTTNEQHRSDQAEHEPMCKAVFNGLMHDPDMDRFSIENPNKYGIDMMVVSRFDHFAVDAFHAAVKREIRDANERQHMYQQLEGLMIDSSKLLIELECKTKYTLLREFEYDDIHIAARKEKYFDKRVDLDKASVWVFNNAKTHFLSIPMRIVATAPIIRKNTKYSTNEPFFSVPVSCAIEHEVPNKVWSNARKETM